MKNYSIDDIIPNIDQSIGHYVGVFEETPDPNIQWPHRHNFYSLVWFTKGHGINVIDFNEYEISPTKIFTINPNQIHNWSYSIDSCGYFILLDLPDAKQFNVDFLNPFLNLEKEDIPFVDEIFKRMLTGRNALSSISYLLSLFQKTVNIRYHSSNTLSNFKKIISENIEKNLTIEYYAEVLGIAIATLNQTCREEVGLSAKQLQLELKITEAKRLMLYSLLNTSQIAFKLGFEDSSYFARIFKKKTHFSPTEFRQKYLKKNRKS